MSKLRSESDVVEFVYLCKLLLRTHPDTVKKLRYKTLNWQHLRIVYATRASTLTVRALDQDRQYATWHYAYRDDPGKFEYDLRTIRHALPKLQTATVLDRIADV